MAASVLFEECRHRYSCLYGRRYWRFFTGCRFPACFGRERDRLERWTENMISLLY